MDESPASFFRSLGAVVFLAILATILARPVFDSGRPSDRADQPASVETLRLDEALDAGPTVSPIEASPSPSDRDGSIHLAARLPRSCLRSEVAPTGSGSIAAASRGRISVGSPATVSARFKGRAPVMWSPSGRYLAYGAASFFDFEAHITSSMFGRRPDAWTWSPVADCMFGLVGDALLAGPPGSDGVPVVTGSISGFRLTEDGRFLGVHDDEGTTVGFDLRRHRRVPERRTSPIFEGVAPFGCSAVPEDYVSASCSESRRFGVAIHNPDHDEGLLGRLWLISADGDPIQQIAGGAYEDTAPEWGPSGTGVVFLRRPVERGRLEVWFLPEGGNPSPTPLAISGIGHLVGHESFRPDTFVDWNVTPPDGEPVSAG